jgi:hypothetical protein
MRSVKGNTNRRKEKKAKKWSWVDRGGGVKGVKTKKGRRLAAESTVNGGSSCLFSSLFLPLSLALLSLSFYFLP